MEKAILFKTDSMILKNNLYTNLTNLGEDESLLVRTCDPNKPKTMVLYYIRRYKQEMYNKPMLAFDYLLEGLLLGSLKFDDRTSGQLLESLLIYSKRIKDNSKIPVSSWEDIFKPNFWVSRDEKRRAAFLLLRIVGSNCEIIIDILNLEPRLVSLFREVIPDIASKLKITNHEQTYLQMQKWRDFGRDLFDNWNRLDLSDPEKYDRYRQDIQSVFGNLRKYYNYYIDFEGSKDFPESLFISIETFNNAIDAGDIPKAQIEFENLKNHAIKTFKNDSIYIRYFVFKLINNTLITFNNRLKKVYKPALLEVTPIERYYPFFDNEVEIVLRLMVNNDGGGFANNVKLDIEFFEKVYVDNQLTKVFSYYWSQLRPGSISLEIPVKINKPSHNSLGAIFSLTWRDWEKQNEPIEDFLEFKCQEKKVDWEALEQSQRYSIEPVRNDEEFIGRKSRITPIVSDIQTNLGSSWVFGQRRIGKTSTVLGVKRELERKNNFIVAYTSYGEFSHHDPKTIIDQLVDTLASDLLSQINRDIELPKLNGSLVPLFKFIKGVNKVSGKYIFFMIDEIDELPYAFF